LDVLCPQVWHTAALPFCTFNNSYTALLPATFCLLLAHTIPPLAGPCLQWQRSFRAVEWWERATLDSLDNGAYADALPLLQRAQVRTDGRGRPDWQAGWWAWWAWC